MEKDSKNNLSKKEDWPKTYEEAVYNIINKLNDDTKAEILETKYEKLIGFNRLWGMGIRNNFGLWRGNHELMQSCMKLRDIDSYDPDIVSLIIIEEVWKKLKG